MRGSISYFAYLSMIEEASLTPKWGLVDMFHNSTHKDMDWHLLFLSANAIYPYFKEIEEKQFANDKERDWIDLIDIGKRCEQRMKIVTNNINTHRGQIFLLGLSIYVDKFVENFKEYVEKMVDMSKYYERHFMPKETHGDTVRKKYNKSGLIYELIDGLPSLENAIKVYETNYSKYGRYASLFLSFLEIVSILNDTTTIYRGGIDSLEHIQREAKSLISRKDVFSHQWWKDYRRAERWIEDNNISCGGSADILSLLVFVRYRYFLF